MYYQRFTNPDGSTLAWVNLDAVIAAHPAREGKVSLHTAALNLEVSASQFEDAVKRYQQEQRDRSAVLGRLTQSIDRMTVRFPSSISLHMSGERLCLTGARRATRS